MSAEENFRQLIERFGRCEDYHERDVLLDTLIDLAPHVRLSRQEWTELQTKFNETLEKFYPAPNGPEWVN